MPSESVGEVLSSQFMPHPNSFCETTAVANGSLSYNTTIAAALTLGLLVHLYIQFLFEVSKSPI